MVLQAEAATLRDPEADAGNYVGSDTDNYGICGREAVRLFKRVHMAGG